MRRLGRLVPVVFALAWPAACAEPPGKEMNQAQGAIDTARAAGADRFAADEFSAAMQALSRSEDAVKAGDYRQALSHALDSRERAQNAAKAAVESRANARGAAERAMAEVATLLERANGRLADAAVTRLPARELAGPKNTVETATNALQLARAALDREDYAEVTRALTGMSDRLQAALRVIDAAASPAPGRRQR